jgi:hypothetical protein
MPDTDVNIAPAHKPGTLTLDQRLALFGALTAAGLEAPASRAGLFADVLAYHGMTWEGQSDLGWLSRYQAGLVLAWLHARAGVPEARP